MGRVQGVVESQLLGVSAEAPFAVVRFLHDDDAWVDESGELFVGEVWVCFLVLDDAGPVVVVEVSDYPVEELDA